MAEGEYPCAHCGHQKTMHRCWRLTCPSNGGSVELLAIVVEAGRTVGHSLPIFEQPDGSAVAGRLL